jgi:ubiquinone/menaquinone biosynthesis C-methylase UbiE
MLVKTTKLFSSELNKHLYPILADDYFNTTRVGAYDLATMRTIVRENIKPISDNNDLNILDWGCGNSLWAFGLFPRAFITGVDLSEDNLKYSKINAKENASKFRGLLFDRDISKLSENAFDHAISIALIEFLNEEMFNFIFSKIYNSLRPGAKLFVTHHNYRLFSAVYIPWILRGGYPALKKRLGMDIQKKNTKDVISDFQNIGYIYIDSGGFNPYPCKIWPLVFSNIGYRVRNSLIKDWYSAQYIVLQKPEVDNNTIKGYES